MGVNGGGLAPHHLLALAIPSFPALAPVTGLSI